MTDTDKDTGVIVALAERFETQRLPRARAIKEKVDQGELLDDADIEFLSEVFQDAQHVAPLLEKHPEWQSVVSGAVDLYKEIMDKATENEQRANSKKI